MIGGFINLEFYKIPSQLSGPWGFLKCAQPPITTTKPFPPAVLPKNNETISPTFFRTVMKALVYH
jgi:hypothetical protein